MTNSESFFGDAGIGRNPSIGERVTFRQCPTSSGTVVRCDPCGNSGVPLWYVEWDDGSAFYCATEGLLVEE